MTDMEGMMPELTLNADAAKVEMPSLTLNPEPEAPVLAAEPEKPAVKPVVIDDSMLSEAEKKVVDDFSKKIDISDSQMVLQYGVAAQKGVASFSENALSNVRNKDLGEIGDTLTNLTIEVRNLGQEEEEKGLFGFFKKAGNRMEAMKVQYSKAETNVEKIARELEQHQRVLMKDIAMFDQMYDLNLKYYKELTMYIIAGKKKLAEVQTTQLEELRQIGRAHV